MKRYLLISLWAILCIRAGAASEEKEKPLFYKIDLKEEVGSTTWIYIRNGMAQAETLRADGIILHMNTYGGTVVHADSIRTAILNSRIPVYAFIDNNAASAGALIAIACDSIYMRQGASIGAATVVNQTGEAMPDKYQSYMRATIRATAEAQGKDTVIDRNGDTIVRWRRDPRIAEAMVDERIVIPGLTDSTKVLTFTTLEAIENGFCEGVVQSPDDLIVRRLGCDDYTLRTYRPTAFDKIKGFLTNPALQALLIMLIVGGIYFELQTPGLGFPSVVAVTAAVLYFAPLYIDGLAANWELLMFLAGIVAVALEIFVFPGFGVSGILGAVLIFGALILGAIGNVDFDFDGVGEGEISRSILTVSIGLTLGFALMIYLSHKIGSNGIFSRLALEKSQEVEQGYIGVSDRLQALVGKSGVATTGMRPSGKVEIDGKRYDAVTSFGYIEPNTPVTVVKYENSQLYVKPVETGQTKNGIEQ